MKTVNCLMNENGIKKSDNGCTYILRECFWASKPM